MKWFTQYVSGYILLFVAFKLAKVLFPVAILVALVMDFYKHRYSTGFKNANRTSILLATSFDKYGNVVCGPLFNWLLITKESSYHFGNIWETISMVLGYNQRAGKLTKIGWRLVLILDCFQANHCLVSIGEYWHPVESRWRRIKRVFQ